MPTDPAAMPNYTVHATAIPPEKGLNNAIYSKFILALAVLSDDYMRLIKYFIPRFICYHTVELLQ